MALHLRLKRNDTPYTGKTEALEGLRAQLAKSDPNAVAGEPMIAIYKEGTGDTATTKILFGIADGEGGYSIFDSEAAASEAQGILDRIMGEGVPNQDYDTIKEIADALVKINGSGEGSINKAEQDAKDYADTQITAAVGALDVTDTAEARKFVTAVSETDGVITVSRGAVKSSGGTITVTDGGDGGINIEVVSSALTQYEGQNAIKVNADTGDTNTKTISLAINTADKVLTQSGDGLLANIDLTWSSTDGLKLIGKDSTVIQTIPASDFVKDGMLQNVELKVATAEAPIDKKTRGTFLVFTFNTDAGSKVINVEVTSLIDVYTAGNGISVDGKVISAKIDSASEGGFLTVGANGIKLNGITAAINAAVADEDKKVGNIISGVGLGADGSHQKADGKYTGGATTVVGEIDALDKALATVSGKADNVQAEVDKVETAVGLKADGTYSANTANTYTSAATSVADAVTKLDAQAKANADAITAEKSRATGAEDALDGRIDALEAFSGNTVTGITAGNGISVSGTGNTRTVAVKVKASDPLIEVTDAGVGIKDGGIIDGGIY